MPNSAAAQCNCPDHSPKGKRFVACADAATHLHKRMTAQKAVSRQLRRAAPLAGPELSRCDAPPPKNSQSNPIFPLFSRRHSLGGIYGRFPLSLRNDRDLLFERGIGLLRETLRLWPNRFGPLFAVDIRRQRVNRMTIVSAVWLGAG